MQKFKAGSLNRFIIWKKKVNFNFLYGARCVESGGFVRCLGLEYLVARFGSCLIQFGEL